MCFVLTLLYGGVVSVILSAVCIQFLSTQTSLLDLCNPPKLRKNQCFSNKSTYILVGLATLVIKGSPDIIMMCLLL